MEKLYPVIKYAKTSLGRRLPEGRRGMMLAYCPVCDKRLSVKKVHPKYGRPWDYAYRQERNGGAMVGKPIHCEGCGNLIHPLS